KEYQATYLRLLRKILPHRLMWYDGACLNFIIEQNSKIKSSAIKETVEEIYQALKKTDNRRPIQNPEIIIGKKSEYPCFSIPDYLLAIFSRYGRFNEEKENLRIDQFERLRDKYRLIIDADSGVEYSRRKSFLPW